MYGRRRWKLFGSLSITAALVLGTVGAASGAAPKGIGEASTTVSLVSADLTSVPVVGSIGASLGTATANATTIDSPFAEVLFDAIRSGGDVHGSHRAASHDGTDSQSISESFGSAGVGGSLTVAEFLADVTDETATAVVGALNGDVSVGPLGLGATSGQNGIRSIVDPHQAFSRAGVVLGPVSLDVSDIIPAELMDALPLKAVLDLVKGLNVDIPGNLRGVVGQLRQLVAALDQIPDVSAQLDVAQAQLDDALADNVGLQQQIDAAEQAVVTATTAFDAAEAALATAEQNVTAAQTQVTAFEAQVAALEAQKDALEAQLPACIIDCAILQGQITAIDAQIATKNAELSAARANLVSAEAAASTATSAFDAAEANLSAAEGALDTLMDTLDATPVGDLMDLVDELQATLNGLLDTVEGIIGSLPDLDALLQGVVDALADTSLLDVGKIKIGMHSVADATHGAGTVSCDASGITVLGQTIGAQSCRALVGTFSKAQSDIFKLLQSLPVVGAFPAVSISGLQVTESGSSAPDADGWTEGVAGITGLSVGIPSVAVTDVANTLVDEAIAAIEDAVGANVLTGTVQSALVELNAQLDALPTGDITDGLRTVGVNTVMGQMMSRARFQAEASEGTTPTPPTAPEEDDPIAENPPTTDPQGAPMPFTGAPGSSPMAIALATWLMVAGGMLVFFARRTAVEHARNM